MGHGLGSGQDSEVGFGCSSITLKFRVRKVCALIKIPRNTPLVRSSICRFLHGPNKKLVGTKGLQGFAGGSEGAEETVVQGKLQASGLQESGIRQLGLRIEARLA